MTIDDEAFWELVEDEYAALPKHLVAGLDNVAIFVEDRNLDEPDLLGIYEGLDVTEREGYGYGELPDRIVLYREALADISADEEELRREVHITLVHEIAHYWGLDDDQLHALGWA
ncbi:metallopeptidase family protein [Nanchangia anserum]|uniref:Metallopeptidase family protein n=1 Tax=Nanchangia anserum TaxID=2692125 RepID=A0A8I0GBH9_9ACTO|nr:metallopeptidase family protein [Nanchangia anserum]MBD3689236.1 metallopeptidase family protein [Nanchangia anserum]QOX81457.1 metallopeptidase family protein [Nanchangia anserum]